MNVKMVKAILCLNIIQIIVYLFGFFNKVAEMTGKIPWITISTIWNNFYGILFWSVLSMLCIVGFTLTLYLLLSKAFNSKRNVGLIVTTIGYGSPILFGFFLLIPATLLILGTIFIKWLIIDAEKSQSID